MNGDVWLKEAEAKMKDALAALQSKRYSAACFWAQQSAEMAFKAVFLKQKNQTPPRVHDLLVFVRDLAAPKEVKTAATILNPAYTSARYIDVTGSPPSEYYKKTDAENAIKQAKEVLKWCKSQMI